MVDRNPARMLPQGPDHQKVVRYAAQPGRDIVVRNGLAEETRQPTKLHIVARPGEIDHRRARLIPVFDAKADLPSTPMIVESVES